MNGVVTKDNFSRSITQVKGFAILLVVLGHIASPLSDAIFSFHIPLFFFLGGVFIKTAYPLADILKKNFDRLFVTYFIFGALGLLVNDIKNVLLHRPQEDVFQSMTGLLFWMDAPHLQHYGMVLWFLPALFWARMVSFCLLKYLRVNDFVVFAFCAACAYLFSSFRDVTLPFGLDKGMVALPWVFMGAVFFRHKEKVLAMPVWKIVPVALLALSIAYFAGMPQLDLATKNLDHFFVALPYTFSIIISVLYLAYYLNSCERPPLKVISAALSGFGAESMLVYIVHPYTNNGAYLISTHFFGEGYWFITFAITMAMLMVVMRIKLRYRGTLLFKYL